MFPEPDIGPNGSEKGEKKFDRIQTKFSGLVVGTMRPPGKIKVWTQVFQEPVQEARKEIWGFRPATLESKPLELDQI